MLQKILKKFLQRGFNGCYALVLLLVMLNGYALNLENKRLPLNDFLTISDIHFDPFAACQPQAKSCPVILALQYAEIENWDQILESYDNKDPQYNNDTNYRLFKSTLVAVQDAARQQQPKFALALGDFLAHDFKSHYHFYANEESEEKCNAFIDKTMHYVMQKLKHALPAINIYPVVGNNDGYGEHYTSTPLFYQHMANIWNQLLNDPAEKALMAKAFSDAGYYSMLADKKLRIIVLNTTYFSALAEHVEQEAIKELNWLHEELQMAKQNQERVILALHIPFGVDVYTTVKNNEVALAWAERYTNRLRQEISMAPGTIAAILAGHVHMDWWQIMHEGNEDIPVIGTPAVSPLFGNNPGFKMYYYINAPFRLDNYLTYYTSLADTRLTWQREYEFRSTYLPNHTDVTMMAGMQAIEKRGPSADFYQRYYAVDTNSQPLTTQNKWIPFYWCAIHHYLTATYQKCLQE